MRATALYTFASVIPLCCAEQPQDYTCKTSTEDTVCAYSSIYSVPPTHTFTLKLTIPKFFQNYLWHVKKSKKKLFWGELWEEMKWGEKKAITPPIFHNSYPVFWWFSDFCGWGLSSFSSAQGKRMLRPSPSASSSKWPSQSSSCWDSWPGYTFKQSPVEELAECQCQLFTSWEELRPLCQARTT